jgi:acetyltransferase-like isoleucine patch superfamily enzyme
LGAALRGAAYEALGHAERTGGTGRLLIGPTETSFIESGAKVVLEAAQEGPPDGAPEDFNRFACSLGVLNPRRYQNPPSHASRFRLARDSRLRLAEHARVGPGFYFSLGARAEVRIGAWTYIGSDFQAHCRSSISIGHRCMISHGVTLMDYDGHEITSPGQEPSGSTDGLVNYGCSGPIIIEDEVWLGAGAFILKGVRLGRGAIVAAGSFVTKDVPPAGLAAGNPAKIVRENVRWRHF